MLNLLHSIVTETLTDHVDTVTRSICATTTNRPRCSCVMGVPPSLDTATVMLASCPTVVEETLTVTIQLGTNVPGYTPGRPCYGCSPCAGSVSTQPCSEKSGSSIRVTTTITTTTTTTTTTITTPATTSTYFTFTNTTNTPKCTESGGSRSTGTSTLFENPGVSSSSSSTSAGTNTAYQPTVAPPITAGGVRNVIADIMTLVVGFIVAGVLSLGM
ncbi:hypothetical protein VTI28DRAFT_8641 [Corynascus sepedonium]